MLKNINAEARIRAALSHINESTKLIQKQGQHKDTTWEELQEMRVTLGMLRAAALLISEGHSHFHKPGD